MKPLFSCGLLLAVTLLTCTFVLGQSQEKVLYSFGTNLNDGSTPNDGLIFDGAGNIYGTTQNGGLAEGGTVFELMPQQDGTWDETVLYTFCTLPSCADGLEPRAGLISDNAGNLYGITLAGGKYTGGTCRSAGCGTVFELSPPQQGTSLWTETVLWNFKGNLNGDGAQPYGRLTWDAAQKNIYGTTLNGGSELSLGTIFELSPGSSGEWNESVLYAFCPNGPPCADGAFPNAGLSLDAGSGILFGTTVQGGFRGQWGVVYELSQNAGGGWIETPIHTFTPQSGGNPFSEVSIDKNGNLYGTVSTGSGLAQCGGAWRLMPQMGGIFKASNILFSQSGTSGCNPVAGVLLSPLEDSGFGTTPTGGASNKGTAFNITGAKENAIYNFCSESDCADGSNPSGSVTQHGRAGYGTTLNGGTFNQGTVYEITP